MLPAVLTGLLLAACANPADYDTTRVITSSYVDQGEDDPRFDTLAAVLASSIRFEALVDTARVALQRFTGSGLRIAVVCMLPDTSAVQPWRDLYSISANYLDLPAAGLPLRIAIPPDHFRRYTGARLAVAAIVLYQDADRNQTFDQGEPVWGVSEQQLFAFAEGRRLAQIPTKQYGELHEGPNVLVRFGQEQYPWFKTAPDYASTIFIINVRGPEYTYNIPLPWSMHTPLQARQGKEVGR